MNDRIKQLVEEIGISEVESILEELKKSETTCCNKSKKCSCDNKQEARDWFHNYLMGVSIYKKEGYPESLFFRYKDGPNIIEQDYENDYLGVSYSQIWSVLKSEYNLKHEEIRDLIEDIVSDTFKIKVSTSNPHDFSI